MINNNKYERFCKLADELKKLKKINSPLKISISEKLSLFEKTIIELKKSKETIIEVRIKETKNYIENNPQKLRLSTFELMERNFKENTHSNILKYLFDYNLIEIGADILAGFLKNIGSIPDGIIEKVKKKKYKVEREVSTGDGRIDILITDDINKFVIAIENKVGATIAKYDYEEEDEYPLKTQLNKYENYVNNKYHGYDKEFIILSHRPVDEDYKDFVKTNYENLYKILSQTSSEDIIFGEYKILLYSLINNLENKEWLITKAKELDSNDKNISLNTLEEINKMCNL